MNQNAEQDARDTAMLAIGACLMDPALVIKLPELHLPSCIHDAVTALQRGDRELLANWLRQRGIAPGKQPGPSVFAKLHKNSNKLETLRLNAEIAAAASCGDLELARNKLTELQAILEQGC